MAKMFPILIIGLGNEYRSDDSAGLRVARAFHNLGLDGVEIVEGISDGAALVDKWRDAEVVIVIDAASSGAKPGTVHCFDARNETIPEDLFFRFSTHSVSLTNSIRMAQALDCLPPILIIYGIEGTDFSPGTELSPPVRKAVTALIDCIRYEMGQWRL